jgi:hypothetical protein
MTVILNHYLKSYSLSIMSSWSNIHIPRKRDISQIPEHSRPHIIPRAEKLEVKLSESYYRPPPQSAISIAKKADANKILDGPRYREYVPTKVETTFSPVATELNYKDKTYIFVILRHLRSVQDNDLWITSYNTVRKFYTNKIVIIDDNSSVNTVDGKLINTEVIKSEFPGAGEVLPYYYFLKYKWADRMIFLHDSMFLGRPFKDNELEGRIKFHWYFTKTYVFDMRKLNSLIYMLKNNTELQAYATDTETIWNGCFGGTAVCDLELVQYLDEEYSIFKNIVMMVKTRKDREAFERLFGIVLYYDGIITDNCANFGDIHKYPGAFDSSSVKYENAIHLLKQKNYDTAIIKVWRGR